MAHSARSWCRSEWHIPQNLISMSTSCDLRSRRSMVAFRTIPDVSAATSACTVRGISPLDDHHLGVSERSPYPGWVPRLKKCKRTDPELEMRNWRGLKNSQGRCITLFQLETEVALHARIVSTNASLRTHSQRQLVVIIEQRLNPQLFFSSSSSCSKPKETANHDEKNRVGETRLRGRHGIITSHGHIN